MHPHVDDEPHDTRLTAALQRLRELPGETHAPYDWLEFRRRASRKRPKEGLAWRHAAVAAGVAGAVFAAALWIRADAPLEPAVTPAAPHESMVATADESDLASRWLAALPQEPAIVRVDTRFAVTGLEDSIAWVDELLTHERAHAAEPSRVMALQRERSRLVDSLVRVRYAETLAGEMQ